MGFYPTFGARTSGGFIPRLDFAIRVKTRGSLPDYVSLREGSDSGKKRRHDEPEPERAAGSETGPKIIEAIQGNGPGPVGGLEDFLMRWPHVVLIVAGLVAVVDRARTHPFPDPGTVPALVLIRSVSPATAWAIEAWYLVAPGALVLLGGMLLLGSWRVWIEPGRRRRAGWGALPSWPISPDDEAPAIVIGETHHPVEVRPVPDPDWLVIPERGLYTGVAIFGAVGSGKTSACMAPFARQLLSWQADDPQKRAAALVLEVKGDFCHQVRRILARAGREDDYIELSLDGAWQWNPLSSDWLDSYSLAYTIASLLSQLFGRGKDPFWQMAYTNLLRCLIELHRVVPGDHVVTLRDLYRCAISPKLFVKKLNEAQTELKSNPPERNREDRLERLKAVRLWYDEDWIKMDPKLRTSVVEGISSFLGLFDMPDIARVFCPRVPAPSPGEDAGGEKDAFQIREGMKQHLPPLDELIESGKVLALNFPAGANPALARAVGVFLKNAWLQTLLLRPARIEQHPDRYFRPAVFICDEYQSFATVGESDPSGDEKAFAMTRQCRVIPIVATQSISSLRSVLGGSEAWRTLLQTLRTRIFLSLSDESSAEIASNLCGQVGRVKASWTVSESTRQAEVSLLSGRAGGGRGSVGASKSFREQREALFPPRSFRLLGNCQAICLPYDGTRAHSATRVYLKPAYLPETLSYWRALEAKKI